MIGLVAGGSSMRAERDVRYSGGVGERVGTMGHLIMPGRRLSSSKELAAGTR